MPSPEPNRSRVDPSTKVGAIVLGAGNSRRMGGVDKILLPLVGRPLVAHSLSVFNDCPHVGTIVLVMSPDMVEAGWRLVEESGWHKVKEVCSGGRRRQDSVRAGLNSLHDTEWTVVHDGARPCIEGDLITRGLLEAKETGAAVAAVPVRDTIKLAGSDLLVTKTLARSSLWAAQTPQVFKMEILSRAHRTVLEDATDDASMVEQIGTTVRIFMGSYENIKITTTADIPVAEAILRAREATGPSRSQ